MKMDDMVFDIINGPLAVLNILVNLFFAFCLVCPSFGMEGLKQPLKLLLGSLVGFTCMALVSVVAVKCLYTYLQTEFLDLCYAAYEIMVYSLYMSTSSSVWLNFFYFTQIVPAQQVVFIWVKRNIKTIIYSFLLADSVFYFFISAVDLSRIIVSQKQSSINGTSEVNELYHLQVTCVYMRLIVVFVGACVIVGSSWATVSYLRRHMESMKESGSPFSSPRLTSQMRVTITGILQGILSLFSALWLFINFFFSNLPTNTAFDYHHNIFYTVLSLYMFGTTVNLGVGQSVFRRRAAGIWLKAQRAIRSLKSHE